MAEGRYADWNVRQVAQSFASKRPKHVWFENSPNDYYTSLRSWAHICANQLNMMELSERQLIIFIYALGMDNVGVKTFDPSDASGPPNDYEPSEAHPEVEIFEPSEAHTTQQAALDIQPNDSFGGTK